MSLILRGRRIWHSTRICFNHLRRFLEPIVRDSNGHTNIATRAIRDIRCAITGCACRIKANPRGQNMAFSLPPRPAGCQQRTSNGRIQFSEEERRRCISYSSISPTSNERIRTLLVNSLAHSLSSNTRTINKGHVPCPGRTIARPLFLGRRRKAGERGSSVFAFLSFLGSLTIILGMAMMVRGQASTCASVLLNSRFGFYHRPLVRRHGW